MNGNIVAQFAAAAAALNIPLSQLKPPLSSLLSLCIKLSEDIRNEPVVCVYLLTQRSSKAQSCATFPLRYP